MRTVALAAVLGLVAESAFAIFAYTSGWGPCGPGTVLGFIGMAAHLVPGVLAGAAFESAVGRAPAASLAVVIGTQLVAWVLFFWSVLRGVRRRQRRTA